MPTVEGDVATSRAGRYLVQLCRHAGSMRTHRQLDGRTRHGAGTVQVRHVERTETDGVL